MEVFARSRPFLPLRALDALWTRGSSYAWHKLLRRLLARSPEWKRQWLYANPRAYWTLRGGDDYFREQEGQGARTWRAAWIAERLISYQPTSILEVGCGYGKLLAEIAARTTIPLAGIDFSGTQLAYARRILAGPARATLVLGRGERLPFPDQAFDMVVTSAVILHNPPPVAEAMRREILRVARRFTAHNEERGVSYNRYGYDTAQWYRQHGFDLLEVGPIPSDPDPAVSQFCVVRVDKLAGRDCTIFS